MSEALLSKRNKVLRFFPVPRYLALGAVACSLEQDTVRFIELVPQGNNMVVRRSGEKKMPSALADDADEIPADIKKAVAKIISDEKLRSVSVVLPERLAYVFFITIPLVEPAFIREALAFKLEEHIPVPPGDVVFEYDVMKRDERAKMMTIAVRAVPRKQVEKYVELFTSAGVLVSQCDTEGRCALSSALSSADNVSRLAIKIGAKETAIFIAQGRSVLFSSVVPFGADNILGIDQASLPTLNSIKDEAKKILEYWNTRPDADNTSNAESVLLFGGAVMYSGVKEYFETALSCPAAIADVWRNAFSLDEIVPNIAAKSAADFASVIGLSLSQ